MTRLLIYLLLLGSVLYFLTWWGRRQNAGTETVKSSSKSAKRFRGKKNPREVWVQVYETATLDEARVFQARLQEEDLECIIYEQGKKDIHGNPLTGVGIAVPRSAAPQAQSIISRMPT